VIILKYLSGSKGDNYGAAYTYDANGRLTAYMPVSPNQSAPVVVPPVVNANQASTAATTSNGVSLSDLGLTESSAKELGLIA
jgi:hypothetical protein